MSPIRLKVSQSDSQQWREMIIYKKSLLTVVATIISAVLLVSLSSNESKSSTSTLSSTSGVGIRYSIQASNIRQITSPSNSCETQLGITIGSPKGVSGRVEVGLYSDHDLLISSKSEYFTSESFSNLIVDFEGCGGPNWRFHTYEVVVYTDYVQTTQTSFGLVSYTGSETIELGTIQSPPNRSKPKVIQASVLPATKTANVVLGTNQKANDPKFKIYYQVTPKFVKPSQSKWKLAQGQVFTITSLKSKTSYNLHTRLKSYDGVFGESKTTSFRTK